MRTNPAASLLLALMCALGLTASCGSSAKSGEASSETSAGGRFEEGKDYLVMERHRFPDAQRFDQPVEAFSGLFPKGWNVEGSVQWKGIQACRGEIMSKVVTATSPDGAIRYEVLPVRSFGWADDAMMMQALQAGARAGGCQLNRPFDAAEYATRFARETLGATLSDIRPDEAQAPMLQKLDADANAISRQYGNGMTQSSSLIFGKLTWPNGDEGILHTGVTNLVTSKPDYFTGRMSTFSSTVVFYTTVMRYPAMQRDQATKLYGMIQSSFRENPIWRKAKDDFMTRLGTAEHNARMETLRLQGEQSRAYARAQSEASDQRMRDWESQQASQDQSHKQFIQTIREVETWSDGSGKVELSSGYDQAWSRGDGTYILSNSPGFDPNAVLQDSTSWQEMKRTKP